MSLLDALGDHEFPEGLLIPELGVLRFGESPGVGLRDVLLLDDVQSAPAPS